MREFSEQERVRREKVDEIRKVCNPYPDHFVKTHSLLEAGKLEDDTKDVSIAGRIVFVRKMGKLSFVKIRDIEADMQIELRSDVLGDEKYDFFKKLIDTGDFIGVTGEVFTTQTGEKTIRVQDYVFLGKALRPLPEKFHGLTDTELKYRERYVDLIMNQDSREIFLARSKFYYFIRKFMYEHGFLEVETPIVQTTVSGASAKPFFTHHNALNLDCNLRIAPECYLKVCNAGGMDKVYEVAKCFRNEGMDPQHLQEFTQIEWYASYWNFEDNIKFFKEFLVEACKFLKGTTVITVEGQEVDLAKEWKRINYVEELTNQLGFDFLEIDDPDELKEKIVGTGKFTMKDLDEYKSLPQIIDFAYKKLIRSDIIEPTVIWNYPACLKPLARVNDDNNKITDVFQVVLGSAEIVNAYSELVNPEIQRANFEEQLKQKELGDDETMDLDEDYLKCMEQGMPPISGLGTGIDRLMMLLYNADSVRDVVLFPIMKPIDNKNINRSSNVEDNSFSKLTKTDFSKVVIEPLFTDYVDFDKFSECDFRAVKILDCEEVKKSNKLLKFTLNDGSGEDRIILSGIHSYYEPEELIGKTALAITNLPPRKMMGVESNGMLLSMIHSEGEEEKLHFIILDNEVPAGAKLY